jgi:hypothetical protein
MWRGLLILFTLFWGPTIVLILIGAAFMKAIGLVH